MPVSPLPVQSTALPLPRRLTVNLPATAGETAVPPTQPAVGAGGFVPETVGVGGGAVALENAAVEDQRSSGWASRR